ncbi:hypothetical protein BDV11DRAFT_190187 [Aspergillus similis]
MVFGSVGANRHTVGRSGLDCYPSPKLSQAFLRASNRPWLRTAVRRPKLWSGSASLPLLLTVSFIYVSVLGSTKSCKGQW